MARSADHRVQQFHWHLSLPVLFAAQEFAGYCRLLLWHRGCWCCLARCCCLAVSHPLQAVLKPLLALPWGRGSDRPKHKPKPPDTSCWKTAPFQTCTLLTRSHRPLSRKRIFLIIMHTGILHHDAAKSSCPTFEMSKWGSVPIGLLQRSTILHRAASNLSTCMQ